MGFQTSEYFCAKTAPSWPCSWLAHAEAAARMEDENNTQNQSADDAAQIAKQHAVVRLFNPTLSDCEFTDEACTRTERLRAAATGDLRPGDPSHARRTRGG